MRSFSMKGKVIFLKGKVSMRDAEAEFSNAAVKAVIYQDPWKIYPFPWSYTIAYRDKPYIAKEKTEVLSWDPKLVLQQPASGVYQGIMRRWRIQASFASEPEQAALLDIARSFLGRTRRSNFSGVL
jgi:hypothetical protein